MKQPWIRSASFDLTWFLAPGLLPVLILLLFPAFFEQQSTEISTTSWIVLVLFVDVAHVYSTVFRTYFNPIAYTKYPVVLKVIPIASWVIGVMLYSLDPLLFWRCLAYLAVFHFIRQQYGFIRIYSRKNEEPGWIKKIHTITVYAATFLPILIWHASGQKNFNWFVEGDFLYFDHPALVFAWKILFFCILIFYVFTELYLFQKKKQFNAPRFLFMIGTAASWYFGIVVFNGDLAFTCLNVISHGIPYMALVWCTEKKHAESSKFLKSVFSQYGVLLFAGIIILFAYFEEGLWDGFIWKEHQSVFSPFNALTQIQNSRILAFVIPLLSLPQIVHYVLDGFIWKIHKEKPGWI